VAPLSDHEQKILDEIEANLRTEPAHKRGDPGSPGAHARNFRLGALLFVVGFALLIAFFVTQLVLVGVLAFGAMVSGIVIMAGAGSGYFAARAASGSSTRDKLARSFKGWEESLRQRYRKE
jgi:hypothetical protein